MKSKESPWFFNTISFKILSAFFIAGVTVKGDEPLDGCNFSDNVERNGLPNGAIYAAYVKFPTSFSNALKRTFDEFKMDSIRDKYFNRFFSDNLQVFKIVS